MPTDSQSNRCAWEIRTVLVETATSEPALRATAAENASFASFNFLTFCNCVPQ